jgi:transposase-like protein
MRMMKARYSEGFKEQALKKVFQRDQRSIREVAEEIQINYHTLKGWMKETVAKDALGMSKKEKRPDDWTLSERLTALQESHGLAGEALQAWCRERGVFAHQLVAWQEAFCAGAGEQRASLRALQAENQRLSRELARKEKALAEAAALLVLQKKFQALLGGEVE